MWNQIDLVPFSQPQATVQLVAIPDIETIAIAALLGAFVVAFGFLLAMVVARKE